MDSGKVWCTPQQETVVYSENPVTKVNLDNLWELGDSIDFLSSNNLNSMFAIDYYKGKICTIVFFLLQIHVYTLLLILYFKGS